MKEHKTRGIHITKQELDWAINVSYWTGCVATVFITLIAIGFILLIWN